MNSYFDVIEKHNCDSKKKLMVMAVSKTKYCLNTKFMDMFSDVLEAVKENGRLKNSVGVICTYAFWIKLNKHKTMKRAHKKRHLLSRGYKPNKTHKTKGW